VASVSLSWAYLELALATARASCSSCGGLFGARGLLRFVPLGPCREQLLMQSVSLGLVFYGYGLGHSQMANRHHRALASYSIFFQAALSAAWLRHFALGRRVALAYPQL